MTDENKDKWDKDKVVQKTNYLSRGNLPGPCQTSCLRSLHLQMVTCESCHSCSSNNCSFKSYLFQLRIWPPAMGPFSSIKRRQVLLSMLFIDARITLRSALVISCVFRVVFDLLIASSLNTNTNTIIKPNLKEESDLAAFPMEPGRIEVGATLWESQVFWRLLVAKQCIASDEWID